MVKFSDQLSLPFGLSEDASFDTFVGVANVRASDMLKAFVTEGRDPFVYIAGPKASGKTHLAISALKCYEDSGVNCAYLSMRSLEQADEHSLPDAYEAFRSYQALIIDDIHIGLPHSGREALIFNLFNALKETMSQMIVLANCSVPQLNLSLPDLESRLSSGLSLRLRELADGDKEKVFQQVAFSRGLSVTPEVASFILRRSGRELTDLLGVLDVLDRAAWVEKQKLSIPFIKKVMAW